ncbi:MAG: flavodoxin family protein [Promethearchaeota archaeon]
MNILYISGSPRKRSNTDYLLSLALSITGGRFIKIINYNIHPCNACWACLKTAKCTINDDMTEILIPLLLECEGIVLGSPVFFNNITAQLKAFIDRTWAVKGKLKNKIGGAIVVGRKYGAENAITAIHAFFLKHEIIPANRGVNGIAFAINEIKTDFEAIEATERLALRILELHKLIKKLD